MSAPPRTEAVVAAAVGLTKRYPPDVTALDEVSFTVGPGEFVARARRRSSAASPG